MHTQLIKTLLILSAVSSLGHAYAGEPASTVVAAQDSIVRMAPAIITGHRVNSNITITRLDPVTITARRGAEKSMSNTASTSARADRALLAKNN